MGYADSSYAGNLEDKKSITGYCFFLSGAIISWYSKRQYIVSISTSETKYIAMSQGAKKRIRIQQFLNKLLPENAVREMKILGDDKINLILTKDPESQNQTKYIDVMHHYVRGLVEDGKLAIK